MIATLVVSISGVAGQRTRSLNVIVLTGELAAIVERRWEARRVTRSNGTTLLSNYVFHRDGVRVGDFRRRWATACIAAGFCRPKLDGDGRPVVGRKGQPVMEPTVLLHDFRRSAARNLRRSGIGPEVAMKITGHETPAMWRRYSIIRDDDIRSPRRRSGLHRRAGGAQAGLGESDCTPGRAPMTATEFGHNFDRKTKSAARHRALSACVKWRARRDLNPRPLD